MSWQDRSPPWPTARLSRAKVGLFPWAFTCSRGERGLFAALGHTAESLLGRVPGLPAPGVASRQPPQPVARDGRCDAPLRRRPLLRGRPLIDLPR